MTGQMSDLERSFAYHWRVLGGPPLTREHRFAPPRRWRLDFAHLPTRVAVECEGGVWTGGRHVRGRGFEADAEKYNAAASMGWAVFRLTSGMLRRDPAGCIEPIIAAIYDKQKATCRAQRAAARRPSPKGGSA